MKILNPAVTADLAAGRKLFLDIGGGCAPKPGFYSIDMVDSVNPDILADLCEPLDQIPDNSVSQVYSRHAFEHFIVLDVLMQELHRAVCSNGVIEIIVPHFSNAYGFSDPTHARVFGLYSMYYFSPTSCQPKRKVPAYYFNSPFEVLKIRIEFYRTSFLDRLFGGLAEKIVNLSFSSQEFYERRLAHFYHAWQIRYILKPIK